MGIFFQYGRPPQITIGGQGCQSGRSQNPLRQSMVNSYNGRQLPRSSTSRIVQMTSESLDRIIVR
jgi:hypothetical protein